jgi:hypothetical protein
VSGALAGRNSLFGPIPGAMPRAGVLHAFGVALLPRRQNVQTPALSSSGEAGGGGGRPFLNGRDRPFRRAQPFPWREERPRPVNLFLVAVPPRRDKSAAMGRDVQRRSRDAATPWSLPQLLVAPSPEAPDVQPLSLEGDRPHCSANPKALRKFALSRQHFVPKGHMTIAQRFNAGFRVAESR